MTGSFKPAITLGDEVTIRLSGKVNLRPYEVEKKKGGFLGIGAKRYKERHNDEREAGSFKTVVALPGTKYISEDGLERTLKFDDSQLNTDKDEYEEIKKDFFLAAFINEGGKNPYLGWSQLKMTVEIETQGRIPYLIKLLAKEKPRSFSKIQPYLEMGNVLRQHPNELARDIVAFYKSNQPEILGQIKQDLYEFLLLKSPGNNAIRSELALTYVESLQFRVALTEAKKVIALLQDKENSTLTAEDKAALATSYLVLAEVSVNERMGTQTNAQLLAAQYYGISAEYFQMIGDKNSYIRTRLKQVKSLQAVSTPEALLQAAEILEDYLKA
ncbi:hypothetical protein [Pedobacter sp.]|uniref:hypothetical protein n=1 Tax=Pedobacter sp. TaxID=1411316 RepID=UPI002CFFB28E|nr:hypothetical protein [Pedobacter sp.]HWW41505.1 hypothetical protein [Pedobacter sp.]